MIVVTVDFPDERQRGSRHLHSSFKDYADAYMWVEYLRGHFGRFNASLDRIDHPEWTCPECRREVRRAQ